ncbi:MAG: hypothetical protein U1F35_00360 [Steroidobacteraceae bacterium]
MTAALPTLPVSASLPALIQALDAHPAAVRAGSPGAGKSTLMPLALLPRSLVGAGRILMLEPRRLAARAVAQRMSQLLGEPVGTRVGYRTRLESRTSRHTRIEVITEGILTRLLQEDPALEAWPASSSMSSMNAACTRTWVWPWRWNHSRPCALTSRSW